MYKANYLIIIILSIIYLGIMTVYSSVQNENINQIFQKTNFISIRNLKPQTNNPFKFNNPPKLNNKDMKLNNKKIFTIDDLNKSIWAIFIPEINLLENIYEGTDLNTLEKGVGHFECSTKDKGNVCLAGHNVGITVSPFRYAYKLEINDILYYKYNNKIYKYILEYKKEINETDFSHITNTKDNKITIITCIVGKKSKRLVLRFNRI